jgi:hypothetical protein
MKLKFITEGVMNTSGDESLLKSILKETQRKSLKNLRLRE